MNVANCSSHGCKNAGIFAPYDFAPNVRFCDFHAMRLIGITVRKILAETREEKDHEDRD